MVTATVTPKSGSTQDQFTEASEQDLTCTTSINMSQNAFVKSDLHSKADDSNDIFPTEEMKTVSIGVGPDTASAHTATPWATATVTSNECSYVGDVYEEKKHGKGALSWLDGHTYTGAFYADKRHGFGTFQTPGISDFKGLYRCDERFGPGVLSYKSSKSADVGLWLNDDLIRLLYPHPSLILDIHITDNVSQRRSPFIIPSWYSPQELLNTAADFDFRFKQNPAALFCQSIHDDNAIFARYLIDYPDRVNEVIYERRAQLDAYLTSIIRSSGQTTKEKIVAERTADVVPPNETNEQQQLYYYANKFLPLKQQAPFSVDDILTNTRSAFLHTGPLETGSLNLLELAFHGRDKEVRDLLLRRLAFVDVCDSRGLTALHFATYNVHNNVVNVLLDSGANVNQLSDDGLTSLALAFLLYYGNDQQETINTALEHNDPVVPNPRVPPAPEPSMSRILQHNLTASSSPRNAKSRGSTVHDIKVPTPSDLTEKKTYGYEMTDELRQRIRDKQFREDLHSLIVLLLRRGADPSLSDWPLPVLALAVRAGDKAMVELLLKKKAQVNCRLSAARHASLTPLHIACGCLEPSAIDIARLLLEHGAQINAESLSGGKEYLSHADQTASDANKIEDQQQQHGRTPLHIACTRPASADTLALVRLLLEHGANPNAVCNGQTPLSLAIALGNEPLVDLLLAHPTTDPSTALGLGNGNALCTVLSTVYEPKWTYAKRLHLIERLVAKNPQVLYPVRFGPKNTFGSVIDYAYYMFFADTRISQNPYHALTTQERTVFNDRKELLAFMAKRFREEASKYDDLLRLPTAMSDCPSQTPSVMFYQRSESRAPSLGGEKNTELNWKATGEFRYCATCGRSTGVRLTPCKRCNKAGFCSKACKVTGWNTFHRHECRRSPSPDGGAGEDRPRTTATTATSKGKRLTDQDGMLFKNSVLSIKASPPESKTRLPPLSVGKLLRQKRLKKLGKLGGNMPPQLPACLEGVKLSWNHMYNAPENYSFN